MMPTQFAPSSEGCPCDRQTYKHTFINNIKYSMIYFSCKLVLQNHLLANSLRKQIQIFFCN